MKTMIAFTTSVIVLVVVAGCENRANKTMLEKEALKKGDYPFAAGDVVLLKPDKKRAVVIDAGCGIKRPRGVYENTYDSNGELASSRFVKVTGFRIRIKYAVRDKVSSTWASSGVLHYKVEVLNWTSVYKQDTARDDVAVPSD